MTVAKFKPMGLAEYKAKRDFGKTAEPKGGKPLPKAVRGASRFVIQKHDARRLHYDFRLQMEGVLKSWAVPKGLPWKQGEKHLAVEVEDHPIEYEDFEGVIPEGNYGGGTVMVWDRGTYYVYGEQPSESLITFTGSSLLSHCARASSISSSKARKPKANGHSFGFAGIKRRINGC